MTSNIDHDHDYANFRDLQEKHFQEVTYNGAPLFTTDAKFLFEQYLACLPPSVRQHYNCRCCKQFIERYGGLVTVNAAGATVSVMWPRNVTGVFGFSYVLADIVERANITGLHVSEESVWGTPWNRPKSGPYVGRTWHHIHVQPSQKLITRPRYKETCEQIAAAKFEEFGMMTRALADFTHEHAAQAVSIAGYAGLDRDDKVIGPLGWFLRLTRDMRDTKNERATIAKLWLAVASAPTGYCHIRTSVAGTILEDVKAGLPVEDIKRKFNKKVDANVYMRPTAAPTSGQIDAAEKAFREMGLESSLARRYARLDEVEAIWKPYVAPSERNAPKGIFDAVRPKVAEPESIHIGNMTWTKFRGTHLPLATSIEFLCPGHGNYFAMLTATDPNSKPVLWWDRDTIEDARNPVSYYVHNGGSFASGWNLPGPQRYVKVDAITLDPSTWMGMGFHVNTPKHVFFVLNGAKPVTPVNSLALFPEDLRKELHGYRKTIEAYSKAHVPTGKLEASACGYMTPIRAEWPNINLRVTTIEGNTFTVRLDRWD